MNITVNNDLMGDYVLISLQDPKSQHELKMAEKGFKIASSMFQQLIDDRHHMLEHVHVDICPVTNILCYDFTIVINLMSFIGKKIRVMARFKDEQRIEFKTELSFGLVTNEKKNFDSLPHRVTIDLSHDSHDRHCAFIAQGLLRIMAIAIECETDSLFRSVNKLKNSYLINHFK